jgi:hypothetical protein
MVHVNILESSLATHTHGPVLRGYAHGGGRGTCAVLAHTASRRALSESARTTACTERRRHVKEYYTFLQRARRVLGGDSRAYGNRVRCGVVLARTARRRLGYGTGTIVGAWSVFLTTHRVLGGYSRGTHGPVRGMIWGGVVEGDVRGTRNGDAEHEHAKEYCIRYRIPNGDGPKPGAAASELTATCGEITHTGVRRCVHRHQRAEALARRRTARHRARGGRTGNSTYSAPTARRGSCRRASSRRNSCDVHGSSRCALKCVCIGPCRALTQAHHAVAALGLRPRGYWTRVLEGGCCMPALFVPGRRKLLQPCRSAHTPSIVRVRILESSLATHTRTDPCCEGTRTAAEGALARCSHTPPHLLSRRGLEGYRQRHLRRTRRVLTEYVPGVGLAGALRVR